MAGSTVSPNRLVLLPASVRSEIHCDRLKLMRPPAYNVRAATRLELPPRTTRVPVAIYCTRTLLVRLRLLLGRARNWFAELIISALQLHMTAFY